MEPSALEPLPSRQREKLISCRFCGHLNQRSSRFCAKCGARIGLGTVVVQVYVKPVAQRFGWMLLLAVPVVLILAIALSFFAGHLGYGNAVRTIVDKVLLGIGAVAFVVVALGVLILTYHKKPKIK